MTMLALSVWARFMTFSFYQHALIAGVVIGVACALLSVFVVHKRMAFIGQGISHSAFGGVGLALLLQLYLPATRPPLVRDAIVAAFCVTAAVLIGRLTRGRRVSADSAIGICLVAAMAIGVLLLDLRTHLFRRMAEAGLLDRAELGYTPSFHDILFGSVLSIPVADVWLAVIEGGCVVLVVLAFFKELVFFTADEEAAEVFGVPVGFVYYGLLVCIALTIVIAMRLFGVILCSALFILPGATASFWSNRVGRVALVSALLAAACVTLGLFLSIWIGVLSTGPLIVLVMALAFGASWAWHTLREGKARLAGRAVPRHHHRHTHPDQHPG
ncbi:MAG: metal ABC transporter permease [Planctomycetota bacterium]